MATLPYQNVSVRPKQGEKISSSVPMEHIQQMIRVKEKVEAAAGPMQARLFVADGNEANGFSAVTVHGPIIAVNFGMLNLIGHDADAMAALIGHELAHLYLNHGQARREREDNRVATSVALSFVLGVFGIPAAYEITNAATASVSSTFSRDEEREADRTGVAYMVKAGFDPYGSVRLQEKLGRASSSGTLSFLSSHPSNSERIQDMKRLAMEYKAGESAK